MVWNTQELHDKFGREENRAIIAYLEKYHPSAHSDVGSELFRASKDIAESQWFSPNIKQYAYVVLHAPSAVIFALAAGMHDLIFRLPPDEIPNALAAGGAIKQEIGDQWVQFNPFRTDAKMAENRADMKHWCEAACQYALGFEAHT